jgi:hypothetical protein
LIDKAKRPAGHPAGSGFTIQAVGEREHENRNPRSFQRFGYDETVTDSQVYQEELKLAERIEDLRYDSHWSVEHHFEDYSFCADNAIYLSYLAAKT